MKALFERKPQDVWIGVFWKRLPQRWPMWEDTTGQQVMGWKYDLWICLVPMLPLHIEWRREDSRAWTPYRYDPPKPLPAIDPNSVPNLSEPEPEKKRRWWRSGLGR